ncbi:MAG TPA: hemerythrin domain-containing protein [Acidimicrobiales bacterium]|nr:hemerythrin domain-containing protein [Acidimicrobiales bacterium]
MPDPERSVTRRQLLVAGGAGLVIGAAGTEIGNLATAPASAPSTSIDPPDVDLMQEHGVLKRILLIYQEAIDRISAGTGPPLAAINRSATIVHQFIEGFHEALEEGYVFPTLRNAGQLVSTVDTLLVQHARGRQRTQVILAATNPTSQTSAADIEQASSAMAAFVRMYQPHEAREDTVVFPAYRAILSPSELDRLGVTFAGLQRQQFGPHGFNDFVAEVASIEESLGIYDLDQFTPPSITP